MPTFSDAGASREPDERFHRFELAEEKADVSPLVGFVPVLQQPLGNAGDARIARFRHALTRGRI